ncbi:MAG: hypothetical protein ACTSYA_06660 [Candidatus Kariarchaeaceae archaeon]
MKGKNIKLLLFIALLSILILPQNAMSSNNEPLADYSRENDSILDVSLPNIPTSDSYTPLSPQPINMITLPSMSEVGTSSRLLRGNNLVVSGLLEDQSYVAWSGETVLIYFTTFHVSDGTGYTDNGPDHLPPNERFDLNEPLMTPFFAGSAVTLSDGTFTHNIAIPDSLEPGIYEIFAWFNGSLTDQSRLPSPIDPESDPVEIYGTIEMSFDANPLSIFVGATTTVTVTLSFDNGTGISSTDANNVNIGETHAAANGTRTHTDSTIVGLGGTDTVSLIIDEEVGEPGEIEINAVYDWGSSVQYTYFYSDLAGSEKILTPISNETVAVTSDTTFTLSWDDGTKTQQDSYRDATWNINGTVINGVEGPRVGVTIDLEITQGVDDITGDITTSAITTVTDALGAYSFWFTLDRIFIPDITSGLITVRVILDPGALLDTFLPSTELTMNIRLMANITDLNIDLTGTDTSIFYTPGDTFDIRGTALDTFGVIAQSVPIELYYGSIPAAYSTGTTNSTGYFNFEDKTVPDAAAEQTKTLFVKAQGTIETEYIYVIAGVNDSLSIDTCFVLTVEYIYNDGTELSFTDPSFPTQLFNDSFLPFFGENVTIRVRDQWGRTPLGIAVKLDFKKGVTTTNIVDDVVTAINDGHWRGGVDIDITAIIELTDLELHLESVAYSTVLTVGTLPDSTYLYTTETINLYQTYGPDRGLPEIIGTISTSPSLLSTVDQKQSVSISVQANDPGTSATGISYVILYYQLSADNIDWGSSTFFKNITLEVSGFWTTWINESSGYVRFWLEAHDYAGYGFNISSGLRYETAQYNASYTQSSDLTEVLTYYTGDDLVPEIFDDASQINGTTPGTFNGTSTYITSQGTEINISVSVSDDLALGSGVDEVTLFYNVSSINPETGEYVGEWSTYSQLMVTTDGNTWWTIITIDEWNQEYRYWFAATDVAGNEDVTDVATNPSFFVLDTTIPDIIPTIIIPENQTILIYPWANDTVQINFIITDTGSGLNETAFDINVGCFYNYTLYTVTLANGSIVEVYSLNGLSVDSYTEEVITVEVFPVLSSYSYNLTLDTHTYNYSVYFSTSLAEYAVITGWINCTDLGANAKVSSFTYQIRAYPITEPVEPDVSGDTGIDTDEEGQDQQRKYLVYGVIITLIVIGVLFLYYQRSIIMGSIKTKQLESKLRSFIDELLEEIRQHSARKEYREAVQKIYTALEEVGRIMIKRPRYQFETAHEYAVALAGLMTVDIESVLAIIYKFEKARYGTDEITYDDFIEAETAFTVIIQTLLSIGAIKTTAPSEEESTPYPPASPPPESNDPENK